MKTIRCILLLLLLPLTGCDKCFPTDMKDYDIPASFNTYFGMFKPGNWWVYQNSDSSIVDSLYVTNYNFVTTKIEKGKCGYVQSKSFDLNAGRFTEGTKYNVSIAQQSVYFADTVILPNGFKAPDLEFYYPSEFGNFPGPVNPDTLGLPYRYSFINQIVVANKTYSDILFYKSQNNYRNIYFAPSTGIVRYTINDTIMNLIRYIIN